MSRGEEEEKEEKEEEKGRKKEEKGTNLERSFFLFSGRLIASLYPLTSSSHSSATIHSCCQVTQGNYVPLDPLLHTETKEKEEEKEEREGKKEKEKERLIPSAAQLLDDSRITLRGTLPRSPSAWHRADGWSLPPGSETARTNQALCSDRVVDHVPNGAGRCSIPCSV